MGDKVNVDRHHGSWCVFAGVLDVVLQLVAFAEEQLTGLSIKGRINFGNCIFDRSSFVYHRSQKSSIAERNATLLRTTFEDGISTGTASGLICRANDAGTRRSDHSMGDHRRRGGNEGDERDREFHRKRW